MSIPLVSQLRHSPMNRFPVARPTFVFLKGQTKVDEVRGADRACVSFTVTHYSTAH